MRSNFTLSDPSDRARSVAATVAIHVALGAALLTGLALKADRHTDDGLKTFDVAPPPPPPPPVPEQPSSAPSKAPAPAGKKADPSPIVAPPARLPTPQTIAAAPVAGTGAASYAGAASSGSGTGAGGIGAGRGGGGGGLGSDVQLLGGVRGRVPRHMLRPFAADNGYAHLLLTIGDSGRVTACSVLQSSGSGAVDGWFCQIMMAQSRWVPARDLAGRPIAVQKRWTSTWSK